MAKDSDARIPGPTMARPQVMRALAATATTMFGDNANTAARAEAPSEIHDRNFRIRPGSVTTYRVATWPDDQADQLEWLDGGGDEPRATSFRPNSSS